MPPTAIRMEARLHMAASAKVTPPGCGNKTIANFKKMVVPTISETNVPQTARMRLPRSALL